MTTQTAAYTEAGSTTRANGMDSWRGKVKVPLRAAASDDKIFSPRIVENGGETRAVANEEGVRRDAEWLDAQLKSSLHTWKEKKNERDAKEQRLLSGRLEHERRKYQKSWEDYYLKRTKLENEGMLLQKVEQKLVAKANIDEGVMFLEHQEEAKDGEQAVLASDLELKLYQNAETRMRNAYERVRNERNQTGNVVYLFRPASGDDADKKLREPGYKFECAHRKLRERHVALQSELIGVRTKLQEGKTRMRTGRNRRGHHKERERHDWDEERDRETNRRRYSDEQPDPLTDNDEDSEETLPLTRMEALEGTYMFDAEAQELEANEALEREMRRNLLGKLEGCSRLHQDQEGIQDNRATEAARARKAGRKKRSNWLDVPYVCVVMAVIGALLALPLAPKVGTTDAGDKATNPVLVVPVYLLLIIPIGLFLTHDVIDKRWRLVKSIRNYSILYGLVSFFGLALLTTYACIQFFAEEYNEGMAAAVSCSVAIYGGYLRVRQRVILVFFTDKLQKAARRIRVHGIRRKGFDLDKLGLPREALAECVKSFSPEQLDDYFPGGSCFDKLSSSLLDDNYPGEGPRVSWLAYDARVIDTLEFVARVGLWVLLASKPFGWSFSRQVQPKTDVECFSPVHPSSKRALWTVDLARIVFGSSPSRHDRGFPPGEDRPVNERYSPSDVGDLLDGAASKGPEGVVAWVNLLRRVPSNEWAEALAEHPSQEVVDLSEATVAWEILLALSSLQTNTSRPGDPSSVQGGLLHLAHTFEEFGVVMEGVVAGGEDDTPVTSLNPPEDMHITFNAEGYSARERLAPVLDSLARQWPILLALLGSSRAPGVVDLQFEEQIKRSHNVDLMVLVSLMLGVVPQWELEFDCEPYLPMNNITLMFKKREEHVLNVVEKYHAGKYNRRRRAGGRASPGQTNASAT